MKLTRQAALEQQAEEIAHQQERHGGLDVAARVAAETHAGPLEEDVLYELAEIKRHIPLGSRISEIIVRGYEG